MNIQFYRTAEGESPFLNWVRRLKDSQIKQRIQARLTRLESGNLGQHRFVAGALLELKIDYGPGFRVYCGMDGETLMIVLCGGDKTTQQKDIDLAKGYWDDYKRRNG
jgi:putative addiction module killer protein